jgi:hypothetical protein
MPRSTYVAVIVIGCCLWAGCEQHPSVIHALSVRKICLTPNVPIDEQLDISLVGVGPDGTATIFVESTNETLSAKPGEPFLGRRGELSARTFGEQGLILRSSNVDAQSATLERWECRRHGGLH